MFVSAS